MNRLAKNPQLRVCPPSLLEWTMSSENLFGRVGLLLTLSLSWPGGLTVANFQIVFYFPLSNKFGHSLSETLLSIKLKRSKPGVVTLFCNMRFGRPESGGLF